MTLDEATASLTSLDLVLQQSDPVFDETIPAGIVVSWMVPDQPGLKAGDTVTPKTTVAVVLSAGPQPRVVPNLTGMTVDQATAALTEQGLVLLQLEPEFDNSGAIAAGLIIRQDLPPDTNVDRGAVISVVVSKGQDLVAVPSLGNLTLQQATDALTAAGLDGGRCHGQHRRCARGRELPRCRRAGRSTAVAWHPHRHRLLLEFTRFPADG